jgi:hypothetical protein
MFVLCEGVYFIMKISRKKSVRLSHFWYLTTFLITTCILQNVKLKCILVQDGGTPDQRRFLPHVLSKSPPVCT